MAVQEPVSPHSQAAEFGKTPLSFGQMCTAEHLLRDEEQNLPLTELQDAAPPQEQSTVLINTPLLLEHTLPLKQLLLEETQ